MTYALDTNIIIQLLRNDSVVCSSRNTALMRGDDLIIPPIVNYEMRRGFYYRSAPIKEKLYRSLCDQYLCGEMTPNVWDRGARLYADLRNSGLLIDDADILISSFCFVNDYALVTSNTRHFERINGLQIENWAE